MKYTNISFMAFLFAVQLVFAPCDEVNKTPPSFYKKLKYELSLAYTQLSSNSWWTKIEPYNIYLGALPLKNKKHLQEIAGLGITRVLSLVEDFELEAGYVNTPVKAADWEKYGILAKQIQAVDFLPLRHSEIEEGVQYLAQMLDEGHNVYVHCKAGRGRSATVVVAYLMQHHLLSFDDAFALVKTQRPQINLNKDQLQALFNYFSIERLPSKQEIVCKSWVDTASEKTYQYLQNNTLICEEKLTYLLEEMLHYVIEGVSYSPGQKVPEALVSKTLQGWIPSINIESTISRRNRYLREYEGNQDAATEACIARNHSFLRRLKIAVSSSIPFFGEPMGYSITLWHQLREIALIAAIHGHDLYDPHVRMKLVSALVGATMIKIPAASTDFLARQILKKIAIQSGLNSVSSIALPAHLIFNFFTDNAAKVSRHAKTLFAGENSIRVPFFEQSSN